MARLFALFWMLLVAHGAMAQSGFSADDVRTVQRELAGEGYEAGEVDGKFGGKTAAAIRQYQSDWQLPQTGEISRDLIDRLLRLHPATQPQWFRIENGDCTVWNERPLAQEIVSWSGGCAAGKASGSGALAWQHVHTGDVINARHYEGEVHDGKRHGRGVFTVVGLFRYEGEWRDGKENGRGVFTFADGGYRYEGEFRDSYFNGHGVLTWTDGDRYEGEFRDDKPNGYGTYTSAGVDYSGNWTDGCLSAKSKNIAVKTTMEACGF